MERGGIDGSHRFVVQFSRQSPSALGSRHGQRRNPAAIVGFLRVAHDDESHRQRRRLRCGRAAVQQDHQQEQHGTDTESRMACAFIRRARGAT